MTTRLSSRSPIASGLLSAALATFALLAAPPASLAGELDCGQPKSTGSTPLTTDALHALRTAVQLASCELCVCDVNDDETVNATDALLTLRKAVGLNVTLACPACLGTIVFVSSESYDGNLGGLAGADEKCQARASLVDLPGTYQAWLSDSSNDVRARVGGTPGPFTLLDGTVVAESFAALTGGSLDAAITMNEYGAPIGSTRVWTGTEKSGPPCFDIDAGVCLSIEPDRHHTSCDDWTSTDGTAVTGVGVTGGTWTLDSARACSGTYALYCVERRPCETSGDCEDTGSTCLEKICGDDGFCAAEFQPATTPCAVEGEPLKDVCGDPDSYARGFCVECNEDTECTEIPEGAFAAGCVDHECVGVTHGSKVFSFTGEPKDFEVPPAVTSIKVTVKGAQGGLEGGRGGVVSATIPISPHTPLVVFVGSAGTANQGGYNGGGARGAANSPGGAGGGASDIRILGDEIEQRIVVAGGGGGSWNDPGSGGNAGGLIGNAGTGAAAGGGGTQEAGGAAGGDTFGCRGEAGSLGQGGAGAIWGTNSICSLFGGGGGGGGYYGGGGAGAAGDKIGGGGGGSSWVTPIASDVVMETGVHEGDGEVTIEW